MKALLRAAITIALLLSSPTTIGQQKPQST